MAGSSITANAAGAASSASSRCRLTTSTMSNTGRKKMAWSLNDSATPKKVAAHHGLFLSKKYRLPRQNAA